jgi:diguanylate cyclase (GGDEF)-like protein
MFGHGISATISLDVSTLVLVATCVAGLLGIFLLYAWNQDRIGALAWWGAAYLIGGFAVALWLADPQAATYIPTCLPSALLFLSCGMVWNAARLFHGHKVLWSGMVAGAVTWVAAAFMPVFAHASANRIILASLIIATYAFLTAVELWQERRKTLVNRWPALFVPALHGAVFLFPIPIAGLMPQEAGIATMATGWLAVFFLEMLLYAVGTAFIVLVLTKERTLRMHKTAALTDPLTGLFNRRGLIEAARDMAEKNARKAGKPVAVLAFDLDHFKTINDRFGHALGDDVLKLFASTANTSLRLTDFVVRLGGEEFAAIMPGTLEEGMVVAERVRAAFEAAARTVSGRYVAATVSVGVAAHASATDIEALLARADIALYAAKANGRNRVESELTALDGPQAPALVPAATEVPAEPAETTVDWSAYRRPHWAPTDRQAA